ncbi:MAG: transglycosylase SLT domain-containing protein, partial [Gallionella sp.]|nr:transglycosylase SLT domain-containing protein [Gallionella sp.]
DGEFPRLLTEDPQLSCYALQSRIRTQREAVLAEAHKLWFTAKMLPGSCAPLFDAAITAGVITQQDIAHRLRLVLETGNVALAKEVALYLAGNLAVSPVALSKAMDNPSRYLESVTLARADTGQLTVALFALQRLARQSPDMAAEQWAPLAASFPMADQQYFYGWLGFEAARKHDPRALQWYRAAGGAPLNEQQLAWRVRAALRALDWAEVLNVINAMSEAQRSEPAWQYWKGRALLAQGQRAEADKLFAPLSAGYDFYALLAGDELGAVMGNAQPAYQPGRTELASIENLPGIRRALALYRMDLRTDGYREWAWAVRNFNDRELLAAAEIARRNEIYDRAIYAAEKTVHVHDFSLRYLAPYRAALREHIRDNGLEEAWVYGLMRQESRFVTAAKSNVGAAGLMQVMPATARWIARKMGWGSYRESMIHQMDTNMKLGTFYMKSVLDNLDDSPVLATAGYNAGPSRARRWRADTPLEGAIYVETIQFDETREYVKKVMCNTVHYAQQFGAPARSLKQRLGVIAGKSADIGNGAEGEVP